MFNDAGKVAAVELARGRRADIDGFVTPLRGLGPVGKLAGIRRGRAGETVGEDLVHHRFGGPGGRSRVGEQLEVLRVEGLDGVQARGVQPEVAAAGRFDQETVAVHRVLHLDLRLPPVPAVDRGDQRGDREAGLAVRVRPGTHRLDRFEPVRDAHPHPHPVAEFRVDPGHIEGRTVVVRFEERAVGAGSRGRHARYFGTAFRREDYGTVTFSTGKRLAITEGTTAKQMTGQPHAVGFFP